jgi:hypothetical protein
MGAAPKPLPDRRKEKLKPKKKAAPKRVTKPAPKKSAPKPKPKPEKPKMAEKKETENKEEGKNDKPLKVQVVGVEPEPIQVKRSDTEQAILDSIGAKEPKEGTREHELWSSLPENIAKKQKEDKEKAEKTKK